MAFLWMMLGFSLTQVAGLAFLLHVGSPQSKEGDDRKEEKLDALLRLLDAKELPNLVAELEYALQ